MSGIKKPPVKPPDNAVARGNKPLELLCEQKNHLLSDEKANSQGHQCLQFSNTSLYLLRASGSSFHTPQSCGFYTVPHISTRQWTDKLSRGRWPWEWPGISTGILIGTFLLRLMRSADSKSENCLSVCLDAYQECKLADEYLQKTRILKRNKNWMWEDMVSDLYSTSNKDLQTPAVKHRSAKRPSNTRQGSRGCRLACYKAVRSRAVTDVFRSCCPFQTAFPLITHRRRQSTLPAYQTTLGTPVALGKVYSACVQSDLWLTWVSQDLRL